MPVEKIALSQQIHNVHFDLLLLLLLLLLFLLLVLLFVSVFVFVSLTQPPMIVCLAAVVACHLILLLLLLLSNDSHFGRQSEDIHVAHTCLNCSTHICIYLQQQQLEIYLNYNNNNNDNKKRKKQLNAMQKEMHFVCNLSLTMTVLFSNPLFSLIVTTQIKIQKYTIH